MHNVNYDIIHESALYQTLLVFHLKEVHIPTI